MTTHHHPIQFEQGPDNEIVVTVPNVRIKLIRNTKGVYWEIAVAGEDMMQVLADTDYVDEYLRRHYGSTD